MDDLAGVFAKLRKAIFGFVVSLRLLGPTWLPLDGVILLTSIERIQILLTSDRTNRYVTWRLCNFVLISLWILLRMRMFPDEICRANHNTRFGFSTLFFLLKSCRLWDNLGKYCIATRATDENMAHAHCMPDNYGNNTDTGTLIMLNNSCFSTSTMETRTRLIVTLYVHCLS